MVLTLQVFYAGVLIGSSLSSAPDFHENVGALLVLRRLSLCQVPLKLTNIKKKKRKEKEIGRHTSFVCSLLSKEPRLKWYLKV